MKSALILIDLQNDYFPGGKMELCGIEEAGNQAKQLLTLAREKKFPVFHVQHLSKRAGASFFLPNTHGVEINEVVAPQQNEMVIQKHYPNSFRDTSLLAHLKENEVSDLILAGAMTHMCIDATTRAAYDLGFNCTVIQDACATKDMNYEDLIIPAKFVHGSFLGALASVYAKTISFVEFSKNTSFS